MYPFHHFIYTSLYYTFFLLFVSPFIFPKFMMALCKKNIHSFLGLTTTTTTNTTTSDHSHSSSKLITESSIGRSSSIFNSKKDPGGIRCFIDEMRGGAGGGGTVNGLMSCTESLGFESSDERTLDDHIEMMMDTSNSTSTSAESSLSSATPSSPPPSLTKRAAKWRNEKREMKKFPPPLSSFNLNGQPSFFLRSVRKNGRLELTEVRIERPEILRASRQDGRLRLHLIRNSYESLMSPTSSSDNHEDEVLHEEEECDNQDPGHEFVEETEEEEEEKEEWKVPVVPPPPASPPPPVCESEGFRWCKEEVITHSHHHNLHTWSQQCVTTS